MAEISIERDRRIFWAKFVLSPESEIAPSIDRIINALDSALYSTFHAVPERNNRGYIIGRQYPETMREFLPRFRGVFVIQSLQNVAKSWGSNNIALSQLDEELVETGFEKIHESGDRFDLEGFRYGFAFNARVVGGAASKIPSFVRPLYRWLWEQQVINY